MHLSAQPRGRTQKTPPDRASAHASVKPLAVAAVGARKNFAFAEKN